MRWPPPVRVTLSPSRFACVLIALLAIASCIVVATLPFPPLVPWLASAAIVGWACDRIVVVGLRCGPRAVRGFELRGDSSVVVAYGGGTACAGRLRAASYVGPTLSTIVWRPYGRWRSRAILILPDMLAPEDFRRLRVLLRYARSDVAQGAPASHA
jgi:hypothetical protein